MGKSKKAKGVLQVQNNDKTLAFSWAIADKLGLNEAIVIQQIHYTATNEKDGRLWAYNTLADWHKKHFPFMSEPTVGRTPSRLVDLGVVLKARYNSRKFDRTTWYAIDYDRLSELVEELEPGSIPHLNSDGGEAGGS